MAGNPSPFVKWAGGKKKLLKILIEYIPDEFCTYIEPFLGGGALFFGLYSMGVLRKAVLSDSNKDLMNCYFAIRDNEDAILTELELLQGHSGEKDFFYDVARPKFNDKHLKTGTEGDPSRAALMIYLNKTCYNGLYRVNSDGEFNVPWGRYDSPKIYDEENIKNVGSVLRDSKIKLLCCDYRSTLGKAKTGDLVYLDPPYQPLNATSSFTSYTSDCFSAEDQNQLAQAFRELDCRGCTVLLSNSYNPLIETLYKEYMDKGLAQKILSSRQISCKGDGRGPIIEYIISTSNIPKSAKE